MYHDLAAKIRDAEFRTAPFKHLYIESVFSPALFQQIVQNPDIRLPQAGSDAELFDIMYARGYETIKFPGCITNERDYIRWHRKKTSTQRAGQTCDGFGMTLRLAQPSTTLSDDLHHLLQSPELLDALSDKFNIDLASTTSETGIQKYLDGYEISPHPDIRRKALTFMANINPHADEDLVHHTHYLRFKPQYRYIYDFWSQNDDVDRCWVPWDWCETAYLQSRNNSMVIFAPAHDTLHAVRADYDHLRSQRTQLYGNLWFKANPRLHKPDWKDLDLRQQNLLRPIHAMARVRRMGQKLREHAASFNL